MGNVPPTRLLEQQPASATGTTVGNIDESPLMIAAAAAAAASNGNATSGRTGRIDKRRRERMRASNTSKRIGLLSRRKRKFHDVSPNDGNDTGNDFYAPSTPREVEERLVATNTNGSTVHSSVLLKKSPPGRRPKEFVQAAAYFTKWSFQEAVKAVSPRPVHHPPPRKKMRKEEDEDKVDDLVGREFTTTTSSSSSSSSMLRRQATATAPPTAAAAPDPPATRITVQPPPPKQQEVQQKQPPSTNNNNNNRQGLMGRFFGGFKTPESSSTSYKKSTMMESQEHNVAVCANVDNYVNYDNAAQPKNTGYKLWEAQACPLCGSHQAHQHKYGCILRVGCTEDSFTADSSSDATANGDKKNKTKSSSKKSPHNKRSKAKHTSSSKSKKNDESKRTSSHPSSWTRGAGGSGGRKATPSNSTSKKKSSGNVKPNTMLSYQSIRHLLEESQHRHHHQDDTAVLDNDINNTHPTRVYGSVAPVPVETLLNYIMELCPKLYPHSNQPLQDAQNQQRLAWFQDTFLAHDNTATKNDDDDDYDDQSFLFACPKQPIHKRIYNGQQQSLPSPQYSILSETKVGLVRWEFLKESSVWLKCRLCTDKLGCHGFEKVVPVFDSKGKPIFVASYVYKCRRCGLEESGTGHDFLARLPAIAQQEQYLSPARWVKPGFRFHVTHSLADMIQTALDSGSSRGVDNDNDDVVRSGARRVERFLHTMFLGLYNMEESRYRVGWGGSPREAFPSFEEWFGPSLDIPTAAEIQELYLFANSSRSTTSNV